MFPPYTDYTCIGLHEAFPSDDIFPWISYAVVVEVVDLVPGSIPERVQYANMEDWRMDCLWSLGFGCIPVKRSASLFSMYHASNDCTIEIEGP